MYLSDLATRPVPWDDAIKIMDANKQDKQLYCLLCVGFYTALRQFEIASLTFEDVVAKTHADVLVKGGKIRRIKLHKKLIEAINIWHGEFSQKMYYHPSMKLIHNKKDKYNRYQPISCYAMTTMLRRAVRRSGVKVYKVTSHFMRKTFATAIFNQLGADEKALITVSTMLGHSGHYVTRRYLGLEDMILDKVYDIL